MPTPTERTRVRRLPKRGRYDRRTIDGILDEGFVCHLGLSLEEGPLVVPTTYGRRGDLLYVHGSAASRTILALSSSVPVCLTVTLVDGLVLARSAFHHSINYRSVMVFGNGRPVVDDDEKLAGLRSVVEHIVPGRWEEVRHPNAHELKATALVCLSLDEASAKVRNGPPVDDEADYALPLWAGVVPFVTEFRAPLPDPRNIVTSPPPAVRSIVETGRGASAAGSSNEPTDNEPGP